MNDVSLNLSIGGVAIRIPDLRRSPEVEAALGLFLRALADEVDPEEVTHAGHGETEPQGRS